MHVRMDGLWDWFYYVRVDLKSDTEVDSHITKMKMLNIQEESEHNVSNGSTVT